MLAAAREKALQHTFDAALARMPGTREKGALTTAPMLTTARHPPSPPAPQARQQKLQAEVEARKAEREAEEARAAPLMTPDKD